MSLDLDKKIVTLCAHYPELTASSFQDLKPEYIKSHYRKIFNLLQSYYQKYQKIPSLDLLEEKLTGEKERIFGDDPSADSVILSFRTEGALLSKDDYPFIVEELKHRASSEKFQKDIPKAVKLFKEAKDIKSATSTLQDIVTYVKNTQETAVTKRVDHKKFATFLKDKYQTTKDNPDTAWGLKTGFHLLDEATYGLAAGEMLVIAARHGNGKSIWLLNACVNMFRAGHNVVLVSLEMPWEQYAERLISCYADLPIDAIKGGKLTVEQEEKLHTALTDLHARPNSFTIIDMPHTTVPNIAAELSLIADTHQPHVLAVDYLGIVKATDTKLKDNEAQASVVEEMRQLGRQKGIPIMTAVQLNREPNRQKKTKSTERLSRSDVIGATADIVLQIEEVDPEEMMTKLSDRTKIHVAKNRKGRSGFDFEVRKNFSCSQFVDWSPALAFAALKIK